MAAYGKAKKFGFRMQPLFACWFDYGQFRQLGRVCRRNEPALFGIGRRAEGAQKVLRLPKLSRSFFAKLIESSGSNHRFEFLTGRHDPVEKIGQRSERDAFSRLETMVMMASQHVPDKVIRQQLASAINVVVHCARMIDGTRKVTAISEVAGVENDQVEMQDLFEFERSGISPRGKVLGRFRASGVTPVCIDRLKAYGIHLSASIFQEVHEVKEK